MYAREWPPPSGGNHEVAGEGRFIRCGCPTICEVVREELRSGQHRCIPAPAPTPTPTPAPTPKPTSNPKPSSDSRLQSLHTRTQNQAHTQTQTTYTKPNHPPNPITRRTPARRGYPPHTPPKPSTCTPIHPPTDTHAHYQTVTSTHGHTHGHTRKEEYPGSTIPKSRKRSQLEPEKISGIRRCFEASANQEAPRI